MKFCQLQFQVPNVRFWMFKPYTDLYMIHGIHVFLHISTYIYDKHQEHVDKYINPMDTYGTFWALFLVGIDFCVWQFVGFFPTQLPLPSPRPYAMPGLPKRRPWVSTWIMANQPTPPGPRTPPRNKAFLNPYEPLVSLNKALLSPYFLGGYVRWGRLTSS